MKNVYYSLIYSQIIYAIEVWRSAVKSELDKILILRKRVMRLVTFNDVFPAIPSPLSPIFVKLYSMKVEVSNGKICFQVLSTPKQFRNWYKLNHRIHEPLH